MIEGSRFCDARFRSRVTAHSHTHARALSQPDLLRAASGAAVRPGIEEFLANVPEALRGKRVGLITNHSAIDRAARAGHRPDRAAQGSEAGRRCSRRSTAFAARRRQARRSSDEADPKTGVPIYSLYKAEDRGPTPEMLENVDVLVYDLQEVGGRTWTYVSTMALSMQAAARKKIPFVVLDRPNPIGGEIVEGALLDPKFKSFVGMYPIPARHGMTVGELAKLFNEKYGIGVRPDRRAGRELAALAVVRGHRAAVGEPVAEPALARGADRAIRDRSTSRAPT